MALLNAKVHKGRVWNTKCFTWIFVWVAQKIKYSSWGPVKDLVFETQFPSKNSKRYCICKFCNDGNMTKVKTITQWRYGTVNQSLKKCKYIGTRNKN